MKTTANNRREKKPKADADPVKTEVEPEIDEFLSLLARIAARVLTKDGIESKNGIIGNCGEENESGDIRKS
jgi:hypothetical protein